MVNVDCGLGTHTGLVRELNEDSYLSKPELGLWAVADGMGGHEAGEVASRITVQEIARGVEQGLSLTEAIESAHRAIRNAALQGQGANDMGSTVVAAKLDGHHYEIGWVGDSRAYLWNGQLKQLTTDHSYVQLLLNAGLITESEISQHPARNVISQALGTGGMGSVNIKIDSVLGELNENATLLLCSDGLSGELNDDRIAALLSQTACNQARVECLITAALEAGGKDNITVIALSRKHSPKSEQAGSF